MSFTSLPTGKLYTKLEKKKPKNVPAGCVGRFYRNLANNDDTFLGSDFYGRTANHADTLSEDVQKYILATGDFTKAMQTDIYHYVTKDRLNNASFRQKLDPIGKNILRRQNPLKLVFEDISTFDAENPIVGFLLRELDAGKKDVTSDLINKGPGPPGLDFVLQNRLNKLKKAMKILTTAIIYHHHLYFYHHNHYLHIHHHHFIVHNDMFHHHNQLYLPPVVSTYRHYLHFHLQTIFLGLM